MGEIICDIQNKGYNRAVTCYKMIWNIMWFNYCSEPSFFSLRNANKSTKYTFYLQISSDNEKVHLGKHQYCVRTDVVALRNKR